MKPLTKDEIAKLPHEAQQAIKNINVGDLGPVAKILLLYQAGVSRSYIVRLGFKKSTVYRQCKDYDKFETATAQAQSLKLS